jgi:hypothetical protein
MVQGLALVMARQHGVTQPLAVRARAATWGQQHAEWMAMMSARLPLIRLSQMVMLARLILV